MTTQSSRGIRVEFREFAAGHKVRYETRMLAVPRVGESVQFPSGRTANVEAVGYVLDVGRRWRRESHAIVYTSGGR